MKKYQIFLRSEPFWIQNLFQSLFRLQLLGDISVTEIKKFHFLRQKSIAYDEKTANMGKFQYIFFVSFPSLLFAKNLRKLKIKNLYIIK